MIIGIAMVVDELKKGERLVFRYPPSIPSSILNSSEYLLKFHEDYMRVSPENFAKLFRPKPALHNKILEITIEDVHYISFPCPCAEDLSSDTSDVITLFNIVIAVVRDSALRRITASVGPTENQAIDPVAASLGLTSISISKDSIFSVLESYSKALLHEEKKCRYVSRQVAQMLRIVESNGNYIKSTPSAGDLSVMDSSSGGVGGVNVGASTAVPGGGNHMENWDYDLSVELMEHLLHHCSLANEMRTIYHGLVGGHSVNVTVNSLLTINIKLAPMYERETTVKIRRNGQSRDVLRRSLSSSISLTSQLSHESLNDSSGKINANFNTSNSNNNNDNNRSDYRPYHSLLLVADLDSVLVLLNSLDGPASASGSSLNPFLTNVSSAVLFSSNASSGAVGGGSGGGSSASSSMGSSLGINNAQVTSSLMSILTNMTHPKIYDVITQSSPMISFMEVSALLDEPLDEIYRIADHLQEWGLARVITTITSQTIYAMTPSDQRLSLSLARSFAAAFGSARGVVEDDLWVQSPSINTNSGSNNVNSGIASINSNGSMSASTGERTPVTPGGLPPRGSPRPVTDSHKVFVDTDRLLMAVLAAFDGRRTLSQCVQHLPKALQPHTVDMVVWLLRRDLITDVKEYVVFDHYLYQNRIFKHATYDNSSHSINSISGVNNGSSNTNTNANINTNGNVNISSSRLRSRSMSQDSDDWGFHSMKPNEGSDPIPSAQTSTHANNINGNNSIGSTGNISHMLQTVDENESNDLPIDENIFADTNAIAVNDLMIKIGKTEEEIRALVRQSPFLQIFHLLE